MLLQLQEEFVLFDVDDAIESNYPFQKRLVLEDNIRAWSRQVFQGY